RPADRGRARVLPRRRAVSRLVLRDRQVDVAAGSGGPPSRRHHGQHHGWQATMLSLTALGLSRLPRPRILDAYLALMLAYGVGNLLNDDWLEQVVKRGWTNHEVPSVLTPAANWGWAAVLVGAVAVWWL